MEAVSQYLQPYGDRVLMPATPYDPRFIVNTDNPEQVTFDERVDAERQYLLTGEHLHSVDAWFKMIGRCPMEEALTLEAYIPDGRGDINDGFIGVPLLYTDAAEYARTWLEATGQDETYDEAAEQRLLNIYNYYKENVGRLMEYVE